MGRPRKELGNLRIIQVNVRMTAGEYVKVSTKAETLGISVADYIRKIGSGKSLPKKKVNPMDRELFVQLSRIGNNINQLTKVYNSGVRDPFNIKEQLIEVKNLLQFLKSNISNNDR
ncbi:MAG: plasmid mobilization relaxosome protein MobC [Bacteroidota bacterium]